MQISTVIPDHISPAGITIGGRIVHISKHIAEGVIPDLGRFAGKGDFGDPAVIKCTMTQHGYRGGNGDLSKAGITKGIVCNIGQAGRQLQLLQRAAAIESKGADLPQTIAECNTFQPRASIEHTFRQLRDGAGQDQQLKLTIVAEGIGQDLGNAFRNGIGLAHQRCCADQAGHLLVKQHIILGGVVGIVGIYGNALQQGAVIEHFIADILQGRGQMDGLQRIAAIEHRIADGENIAHLHLLQGGAIAKAGFAQHGAALDLHRFQIRAVIEGECANGLDIRPDDHLLDVIGVLLPLGILCIEIQHIAAAGNTQRTFRIQLPAKILAAGAGNRPGHIGAVIFRAHGIALVEISGGIVFLSGMIREVAAAAQEIFVIHSVCLPGLIPGGIQVIVQAA